MQTACISRGVQVVKLSWNQWNNLIWSHQRLTSSHPLNLKLENGWGSRLYGVTPAWLLGHFAGRHSKEAGYGMPGIIYWNLSNTYVYRGIIGTLKGPGGCNHFIQCESKWVIWVRQITHTQHLSKDYEKSKWWCASAVPEGKSLMGKGMLLHQRDDADADRGHSWWLDSVWA